MASANKRLQGKVAIVTGSSSGIGEGIALMFASEGCDISLTGRNQKELERVASAIKELGVKAMYTAGDITSDTLRKKLVDNTLSTFGKVDILVNNAGTSSSGDTILDPKYDEFDMVHNVNLRSVYQLCGLTTPHLVKTKGNIINISSIAAWKIFPQVISYCVSKAGLDMLTRCLAAELAPHGVRVNGVNPGGFKTNILRVMPTEVQGQVWESLKDMHALGRNGDVDELAKFVTFLASDDASFMTGINCPVDGGALVK